MSKDQREIARKLRILLHAEKTGHVAKTCRYFGVGRGLLVLGSKRTFIQHDRMTAMSSEADD